MATTQAMRSFNDIMLKPNTTKFISLRLEVRTYHKSTPQEWVVGATYRALQYVKVTTLTGVHHFRCLEEHLATLDKHPFDDTTLWNEVPVTNENSHDFTTAGINYGDWLVDNSLTIRQDDIDLSSSINYNSQQNVTRTVNLNIKNTIDPITLKGLQNWGADFQNNRQKWWLDKRLAVFIQVRLVNRRDADYWEMPMGVFIITGLSSTHTLTNYPITNIQASSAEVLYSSRRGKFDKNITIDRGSSIIDGIKRILIQGGEKPENILISPDVASDFGTDLIKEWEINKRYLINNYIKYIDLSSGIFRFFKCIDEHDSNTTNHPITGINRNLYWTEMASGNLTNQDFRTIIDVSSSNWTSLNTSKISTEEDYTSYRTKYSSTIFSCNDLDQISTFPLRLANYKFGAPMDFSQWSAAAFYARCDMDIYDGTFQIWFYNGRENIYGIWEDDGLPFKLNIGELVGNVTRSRISSVNGTVTEQTEERENWRMMIIPLGFINELKNVYRMELVLNKPVGKVGYQHFNFWLDDIIVSKISHIVPNPLNYTISQNRWQAIKELSDLILCDAYYTRDGYFLLTKQHMLSPTTYIDQIREYLLRYFGPTFNSNSNPTISKIPNFNLIETSTLYQFEPFYNFRNWLISGNRISPALALRISTNNLYSQHLVQPNTYYGDFIINIGLIRYGSSIKAASPNRADKIIAHVNKYFPGMFKSEGSGSGEILKANLISVLYHNSQNSNGQYNYWALDDLFGLQYEAALLVDNDEFSAVFIIDKQGNYQVPQDDVMVTFSDLQEDWRIQRDKRDALYAGGTSTFDEAEMANHIITYGGYENDPIMGKAEGILTEDGFSLKVKGKYINERGRVRGINNMDAPTWQIAEDYSLTWSPQWLGSQFYFQDTFVKNLDQRTQSYEFFRCIQQHTSSSNDEPGIGLDWPKYWKKEAPGFMLNKNTDVDRLYAGCFNIDIIREVLGQDKFLELTQQPVANFTVEKIGDYIYHHNNGQTDSLLKWTWELMNRVIWEFKKRLSYAQKFSFQIKPYYGLDCYDIIKIHDRLLDIVGTDNEIGTGERFKIETISIPLNGNYISITANREYKPNVGIPYFDQSHKVRWGPYFYGIDLLGDNNINYRKSVDQGEQILYDERRLNIGGGSNVSPKIQNTDAPDNASHPGMNYAHFFTQHYPLKHLWGTGYIEDKNESGLSDQRYIVLNDGSVILYNPTIHIEESDGTIKDSEGKVIATTLRLTNMSRPGRPGNNGKRPGYSLEDVKKHKGYATDKAWYPSPLFGQGGDDWRVNINYNIGAIVRIVGTQKYSTIETYVFMRCIKGHISTLDTKPEFSSHSNMGIANEFWMPYNTDGIPWVIGQPIGLTYDFYNLAFFEGEKSLETGYAATPITNGEIEWYFMDPEDKDLMRPFKYLVSNGKWIYSNSLATGYANSRSSSSSSSITASTSSTTARSMSMSFDTIETSPELTNFLTAAFSTSDENVIEPIIHEAINPLLFEAPNIPDYVLDQPQTMYSYDITQSSEPEKHIIKYKPEPKGTIIIQHVWIFNGNPIDIIQQEIYTNIYHHNATALVSKKWSRITEKDTYSIFIDKDDQTKVFTFEYYPLADWTITNNFHGLAINPLLIDEYNKIFLSPENPILITNVDNFCWMEKNTINICGAPKMRANYVLHGKFTNIDNSLASISIRYRNGDFGHFFSPQDLVSIKFYEQIYPYIEPSKVTRICGFIFTHDNPEEIFVL